MDIGAIVNGAIDASDILNNLTSEEQEQQLMLQTYADILLNICLIIMLFIIVFLVTEILDPASPLRSSYFCLIVFGMSLYGIFILVKDLGYILPDEYKSFINNFNQWYIGFDLACWNTFLALNRASALALPVGHDRFWTQKLTIFYCFVILVYPLVADITSFWNTCFWKGFSMGCVKFQVSDQIYASIWSAAHSVFALLITIASLTYSKSKGFDAAHKIECRLMFQTVFGSTMIILFAATQWLAVEFYKRKNMLQFVQFSGISQFLCAFYYYPIIFVLFFARFVVFEFIPGEASISLIGKAVHKDDNPARYFCEWAVKVGPFDTEKTQSSFVLI